MRDELDHLDCHRWYEEGFPGEFIHGEDVYLSDEYLDERWLPVKGFGQRYWVSTHGRVWSNLDGNFIYGSNTRFGYTDLSLRDYSGKRVRRTMHRLVAEAFIPNPNDYPYVLHGDDDPSNNCVWNLRWGTQTDNMRDAIDRGRFKHFTNEDREMAMRKRRTPIIAYDFINDIRHEFVSQSEAERSLGISQGEISAVLRGERRHIKGWIFAKQGDNVPEYDSINVHYHAKKPLIRARNIITGETCMFNGLTEASKSLGVSVASISLILHGKTRNPKVWHFEYTDSEGYDG